MNDEAVECLNQISLPRTAKAIQDLPAERAEEPGARYESS